MALRDLRLLLCVIFLVLSTASAQDTNHGKPRDPTGTAISKFNADTMHYEPVAWDKSYTYYRIKVNLAETFADNFTPDPNEPHLIQIVISGDVFDNSTGVKVGTFDSSTITTRPRTDPMVLQYMGTFAVELGPNGDDTIFVSFAMDRKNFRFDLEDFDQAIIGGTGRYKGATGEVFHTGIDTTEEGKNLYVAEVAVPRFKRF